MARKEKARSAGSRLGRTETVSIRLDPRLNYLCELSAHSQRRTKSSIIEASIADKNEVKPHRSWGDTEDAISIGERAADLWHVRESHRLCSLGFIAPHLLTFEEQEIWELIRDTGWFWRGKWTGDTWTWRCQDRELLRDRVEEQWDTILAVAEGTKPKDALPVGVKNPANGFGDLDDEIPF